MRIGLFGGTFNPIHYGHLRPILEIRESFALDRIYFIPSSLPPHKPLADIAGAADRHQMIELAISDQHSFNLSDVELDRPGLSYSIDTVAHFQAKFPDSTRLYLVLGMDAFLEIDTWKSFRILFNRIAFIVMNRPMETSTERDSLDVFIREKLSEEYRFSVSRSCYVHEEKQPIFMADVTGLNISATQIRDLVRRGKSIRYLVPDPVAEYIHAKGLYV
jgi:nicotinate-nucleotide adenylyltransferase